MNRIHTLLQFALLALGALGLSLCLARVCSAADDHNSSRSNKSGLADSPETEELKAKLGESVTRLDGKIDTLVALLRSIEEQTAQAEALQTEIDAEMAETVVLTGQVTASRKDMLQWYQDMGATGRQVFDEQVAPWLYQEVADAVRKELDYIVQYQESDWDFVNKLAELGEGYGGLGGVIDSLKASVETALKEAGSLETAIKASWNLKENVK